MANTYSQIYIQAVFAVQGRQSLIAPEWKEELYKYITGVITNHKQKLIAINGVSDHIHLLIGFNRLVDVHSGFEQRVNDFDSSFPRRK